MSTVETEANSATTDDMSVGTLRLSTAYLKVFGDGSMSGGDGSLSGHPMPEVRNIAYRNELGLNKIEAVIIAAAAYAWMVFVSVSILALMLLAQGDPSSSRWCRIPLYVMLAAPSGFPSLIVFFNVTLALVCAAAHQLTDRYLIVPLILRYREKQSEAEKFEQWEKELLDDTIRESRFPQCVPARFVPESTGENA